MFTPQAPKFFNKLRRHTSNNFANKLNDINDQTDHITIQSAPEMDSYKNKYLRIRSHTNPSDIILPITKKKITTPTAESEYESELKNNKKIHNNLDKDIAFEIHMENQNIHPVDEPFLLKNGRKIFPNKKNSIVGVSSDNKILVNDILNIVKIFAKNFLNLLNYIWNLDFYLNILKSDNSTIKIHIPSILFCLISLQLFYYILFSNQHNGNKLKNLQYNYPIQDIQNYPNDSNSSATVRILNIFIFGIVILLSIKLYNALINNNSDTNKLDNDILELNKSNSSAHSSNSIKSDATLVDNKSINNNFNDKLLWSENDFSDTDSDFDDYELKNNANFNKHKIDLTTFKNPYRVPVVPVPNHRHRLEEKLKNQPKQIPLNLPIEVSDIEKMKQNGRDKLLKAFLN